jgi:hypothetical protein
MPNSSDNLARFYVNPPEIDVSVTTRFKRALRRNHQRKRLITKPAVATEIREVGGDDLRLGMELGQHDERGGNGSAELRDGGTAAG